MVGAFLTIIYAMLQSYDKDVPVILFLFFFLMIVGLFAFHQWDLLRGLWSGVTPHPKPLIFLSTKLAVGPKLLGHELPEGYRLACLFLVAA